MGKDAPPEWAAFHHIALHSKLNSPSGQHFAGRAANSAAEPDGVIR